MKKLGIVLGVVWVCALGMYALADDRPSFGRPCDVDPNVGCLDIYDPMRCLKPGEGWKTYSNPCYAWKDCAIVATCKPLRRS